MEATFKFDQRDALSYRLRTDGLPVVECQYGGEWDRSAVQPDVFFAAHLAPLFGLPFLDPESTRPRPLRPAGFYELDEYELHDCDER